VSPELPRCTPEEVDLDATILAEIGPTVRKMMDRGRIPGAVVVIARRGRVAFDEAYGSCRTGEPSPYRCDTIVRIYSMAKPVTSVAAMMLIEQGKLQLDDLLTRWIPELGELKVFSKRQTTAQPTEPPIDPPLVPPQEPPQGPTQ
jgi:CubicO group peptidase (beta-lactamase class C family)